MRCMSDCFIKKPARFGKAIAAVLLCHTILFSLSLKAEECGSGDGINIGHAIAMHGSPKYPADFKHFDYVNPAAPKGGSLRQGARGTFDSFHGYIPKGSSASTGSVETLLTGNQDEPFTMYGLVAESMEWPDDRSWIIFTLRDNARWHDGEPITPDDVVWSYETLTTKGSPGYRFSYRGVSKVEKLDERRVKFSFNDLTNRELALIVGQLPILPKHYWQDKDFEKTTLEPPLGSGPYRVKRFEAGRYVELERVEDYWGKDLPVRVGSNNFDIMRTEYFRDDTAVRLALKSGDLDLRLENQAKAWALDYNVPAVEKEWLRKDRVEHQMPTGMQAFVMNTRKELFSDPKVREALAYAFDFDWTNRNLFFSQYSRTQSYFSNSELASSGIPEGRELEILEPYRDQLPKRVFTEEYSPPHTDGSGWPRENLRKAFALFKEAGWEVVDNELRHVKTGKAFSFQVLLVSPDFERIVLPMIRNLKRLGIDASVRVVDTSQYINRLRSFDYDMFVFVWGQAESPGNEQRIFWSSAAADQSDSRNFAGIKNPVVDELIEGLISACSREDLVAWTRALDRTLLWNFYVIPNWHLRADRVLYWDRYSRPDKAVKSGVATSIWWYDQTKSDALDQAMANTDLDVDGEKTSSPGWATIIFWLFAGGIAVVFILRKAMKGRSN
ncbi:MAG: microcin C transport system substrate-binding protein [Parasphingorhabdus sp.]|jgi:microcin C transport system substrate-binding protein